MSIAVIGSINMDLVAEVKRLPTPGETVKALRFESYPGGKGANQAVAAARLGSTVKMLGKVGDDELGAELLQVLKNEGVDTHWIVREADCPTGRACVWVDEEGENSIVFWPGANARVSRAYVDHVLPILSAAQVILLQLEIPVETVADVLRALPRPGPTVILDPAPASAALSLPLARVDILTPNRGELELLSGERNQRAAARQLLGQGVGYVICKNGAQGCSVFSREGTADYPAVRVRAVDTTAAGDAFNGALAAALAAGRRVEEAIQWGNAAGAFAATRKGAQPSLPHVDDLMGILCPQDGENGVDLLGPQAAQP